MSSFPPGCTDCLSLVLHAVLLARYILMLHYNCVLCIGYPKQAGHFFFVFVFSPTLNCFTSQTIIWSVSSLPLITKIHHNQPIIHNVIISTAAKFVFPLFHFDQNDTFGRDSKMYIRIKRGRKLPMGWVFMHYGSLYQRPESHSATIN